MSEEKSTKDKQSIANFILGDNLYSEQKPYIVNRCRCKNCGDIIESKHRHDFVRCLCGSIFTDGGVDYIRRGGLDLNLIEDMSEKNPDYIE